MSEPRKNHLTIDGGQSKDEDHVASYKPIPEADTEFRTSKSSLHKSKEKVDEAEEKLLEKEEEAKIVTRVDMADAKYVVGDHRNGDAKIELDANKRQFSGLTKEELMKYADDPFWVRLRWAMFVLFWALWLCMLAGAIAIIVKAPKCAAPPPKEWYQEYSQVEASDMNLSELDEEFFKLLEHTKVGGVYAKTDCGGDAYEVLTSDTCLEEFKKTVAKAKEHDVKIIANLVANYVPTTHEWFTKSAGREAGYEDFFIWYKPVEYDGVTPKPPNNWPAATTEPDSAWQFNTVRQEFYLSQYGGGKADLNFTNPEVVKKFGEVLKKWVKAGAGGVRLSHARQLLVASSFRNESHRFPSDPLPRGGAPTTGQYDFYRHNYTSDQPALDGLLAHFSQLVDDAAELGPKKSVFTIFEDGSWPEWYLLRANESALRPPTAAAVAVADVAGLPAKINKTLKISKENKLGVWPALQLTTTESEGGDDLAAFAHLLPAAPVLTLAQLQEFNDTKQELSHLASLRRETSIQHGQLELVAVPARNSTEKLVAVARWKPGHTGHVAVLNTQPELLRANLTQIPVLTDKLTVYYASHEVTLQTNYTNNKQVDADDVSVPAYSCVVLSFAPKTAAEQ